MSQYSKEVDGLIELGVAKTINEISARIGNYGAYTYNSADVKKWTNALSFYSAITNFLDEYVEGNEEMDFEKLRMLIRLSLSSSQAGSSSVIVTDYTQTQQIPTASGVSIYVNGTLLTDAPFSVNDGDVCDIKAVYNGQVPNEMIRLEIDSLAVAEESNSVFLNNYKINYLGVQTKTITVSVYYAGNPTPDVITATIVIITN